MKKKQSNKTWMIVIQVVTAFLVGVSLLLQYTSKTHEDIGEVRREVRQEVGEVRKEVREVRQLLTNNLLTLTDKVAELRGKSQSQLTSG